MSTYTFNGQEYTAETLIELTSSELVKLYNDIYAAMNSAQKVSRFADKGTGATRCLKALREYSAFETLKWLAAPASEVPAAPLEGSFDTEEAAEAVCPSDHVVVPVTEGLYVPEPVIEIESDSDLGPEIGGEPDVEAEAPTVMPEDEEAPPAPKSPWAGLAVIPTGKKIAPEGVKSGKERKGIYVVPVGEPKPLREGTKLQIFRDLLEAGSTWEELKAGMSTKGKPWVDASIQSAIYYSMKSRGYGVQSGFNDKGEEVFSLWYAGGAEKPENIKSKKSEA